MISHHHKAVFVHIPKNAGQSIEHVFLNLLDLTWERRAPLLLRPNEIPELGPPRLAHLKSYEYVKYKYMTQEQYDEYFSFSFVRNPWARVISMYKYFGYNKKMEFKRFLVEELRGKMWYDTQWFVGQQYEYVYKDDKPNVDFIGRFENLQSDFNYVCEQIGLPEIIVPHVNQSIKDYKQKKSMKRILLETIWKRKTFPIYRHYQEYYCQDTIKIVGELYEQDIRAFKYTFE